MFLVATVATALPLVFHCGHDRWQCTAYRSPRRPPLPAPPADPGTLRGVEEAGFRYERCENRPRYRLVRAGKRPLTFDEMSVIKRGLRPEIPGPFSTAIGGCECAAPAKAPGEVVPLCISISFRVTDLDPPAVARLVSRRIAELSLTEVAVGVRVDVHSKPGPRCRPDEPACGPIPVGGSCAARDAYVPGRTRTPVFDKLEGGPCAHDGDCDAGECDTCFATGETDRYISGDCFFPEGMKANAMCGCVAGQCTFFVQTP